MLRRNRTTVLILMTAAMTLAAMTLAGCAQLDLTEKLPWPGKDSKPQVPDRMTNMWNYTVLRQPGRPGVRGFGGRIMFFAEDSKQPVKVDGTFIVYAFDATDEDSTQARPELKFIFRPEEVAAHYGKSSLGHSYSFWLPWGEVGGPRRQLSLIAQFESSTGELITAEQTRHVLPGISTDPKKAAESRFHHVSIARERFPIATNVPPGAVRQVGYEQPQQKPPANTLSTTTISVPPSFARQMQAGGNRQPTAVTAAPFYATETYAAPTGGPAVPSAGVAGQTAAAGLTHQSRRPAELSTRFSPRRFPARRALTAEPGYDPVRRQPHPAMWQSRLPAIPRSAPTAGWPPNSPAGSPQSN